ncbi:hypothetical protein KCH_61340 [Kitasatospora cheerisanensis KCTC 2395]|uniref:ABC transporter domain-containing protein n=1 Tax=Kitasatospora cheerisanensis KCTC 2395 TaxID=1348663 RepID=A0A066YKX1_9ACTN|nr:hypothetical protein KCH_61340 [Kitasatospora cheerisanensis KCTC 2395]
MLRRRGTTAGHGTVVHVIEVNELTKRYGSTLAVDGLTFTVRPGRVTGFLGPNGAGKSTTLRMIIGLNAPTGGSVTVRAGPSGTTRAGCGTPVRCSTPRTCTAGAPRPRTWGCWRGATRFRCGGWRRCWRRSGWRPWPGGGSAASRWA